MSNIRDLYDIATGTDWLTKGIRGNIIEGRQHLDLKNFACGALLI